MPELVRAGCAAQRAAPAIHAGEAPLELRRQLRDRLERHMAPARSGPHRDLEQLAAVRADVDVGRVLPQRGGEDRGDCQLFAPVRARDRVEGGEQLGALQAPRKPAPALCRRGGGAASSPSPRDRRPPAAACSAAVRAASAARRPRPAPLCGCGLRRSRAIVSVRISLLPSIGAPDAQLAEIRQRGGRAPHPQDRPQRALRVFEELLVAHEQAAAAGMAQEHDDRDRSVIARLRFMASVRTRRSATSCGRSSRRFDSTTARASRTRKTMYSSTPVRRESSRARSGKCDVSTTCEAPAVSAIARSSCSEISR